MSLFIKRTDMCNQTTRTMTRLTRMVVRRFCGKTSIQVSLYQRETNAPNPNQTTGAWIAATPLPESSFKYSGGIELQRWSDPSENWHEDTQGFSVTVMHQIHCLVWSKPYSPFQNQLISEHLGIDENHLLRIDHTKPYSSATLTL